MKTSKVEQVFSAAPARLRTLKGVAEHLAAMVETTQRGVAEQWFQALSRTMQLDLVRAVQTQTQKVRSLLWLVPDATTLMTFLEVPVLRRVCDDSVGFMSAVEPERALEIVRATANAEAKRMWLLLIQEAYEPDQDRLSRFLGGFTAEELATVFVDLFRVRDIETLDRAKHDPDELEEILDDSHQFVSELAAVDHDLYTGWLEALETLLFTRFEERSREKTLEELMSKRLPE